MPNHGIIKLPAYFWLLHKRIKVSIKKIFFTLLIVSGFLFSCSPVRNVPAGKSLLVKNEIFTDTFILAKDRFQKHLKQKPNRKIIGFFRFHLGVYNLGSSGKNTKFKTWLRSIGEEPVLLDSEMTQRSKEQFKLFLFKNGFFNASITDSVRIKKKKSTIEYYIKYGPFYTIRRLGYFTQDTGISPLLSQYQKNSILIPGERYDEELIDKERERITTELKDRGYYFFNRNFITFQIDTTLGTNQADINLYLNRINENVSTAVSNGNPITDHQTYRLRNIYIQTDYNPKDTTSFVPTDTTFYNGYYILSTGKYRVIKDNILVNNLFIKTGDRYLQRDLDLTYKRLQELDLFKFINFYFKEVPRDFMQKEYLLDIQIQLNPTDKLDFTINTELTNTGSNIGIAGSFGLRNKNTFRGAEVLELKIKGGLEAIPNTKSSETAKRLYVFNTYEIGPELSLKFKKFLLPPFIVKKTSRFSNPSTNISLGYNHQNSPDYVRSISNFGHGYAWSPTTKQRWNIYPIEINSVVVNLSPAFEQKLDDLNDHQLTYAYKTHLITSVRVAWSTTSLTAASNKDFVYFRTSLEVAYKAFGFSLNPSQFVKVDYDFSYYHILNTFSKLVSRVTMGYGQPYDKSKALPFEKSFFGGGANSIRAWYSRTLGPGSFKKTIDIEQSGDIKIESNVEYRSELVQFKNGMKLEGAAFIDAGNVWTQKEDKSRPGGKFEPSHLIGELGIGAGLGMRFNFSFFIFRIDAAVKLRDPSLDEKVRWVYPNQKFVIGDITPNLAIGYPF